MPSIAASLVRREHRQCFVNEDGVIDDNSCYVPFWYTKTGGIVKWSLFLGLILFISLYLIIGYIHAKKRMQKGQPPLSYHRFLVPRHQLAQVDPRYQWPQATAAPYYPQNNNNYGMHNMPPPVYDPNAARPPMYPGPPEGGSKVEPNQQQQTGASPSYDVPPPGPPPQQTGVVENSTNNPYRL